MNTFIFLGCVLPVRYLVDNTRFILLQKLYLTKKILIFWYEKKNKKLPSQRMSLGVFGVKKVTFLGGGGYCRRRFLRVRDNGTTNSKENIPPTGMQY